MRIALGIEYFGAQFYGWQRQQEVDTVQAQCEKALSIVANETIQVQCAGRTDAGVHATGQIVHFDTQSKRELVAWTRGVNAHLPEGIAVRFAQQVSDDFHARFSATARQYRYIISNQPIRSAILNQGVTIHYAHLDAKAMHQAAQSLLGEKDFTSFRASHCQSNTHIRNVHHVSVKRLGQYVVVDIKANAFLHHMVRNIVGSLLMIGEGKQPISWISELLSLRNRALAAPTAKPHGLYLVHVEYPSSFAVQELSKGPLFLPENLAML
jgi:tRNA pseudouridine38-40 synthase